MGLTGVNAAFLLHFRKKIIYSVDILSRKHDYHSWGKASLSLLCYPDTW